MTRDACSDPQLERAFVGGALVQPELLKRHHMPLDALASDACRKTLEALYGLAARSQRVSGPALDTELGRLGYHGLRGFYDKWAKPLLDPEPVVKRLLELRTLRELRGAAAEVVRMADEGCEVHTLENRLRSLLDDVVVVQQERTAVRTHTQAMERSTKAVMAVASGKRGDTVPSGFDLLDQDVGGFWKGDLVVIGGHPNSGKTTTMIHGALTQARGGRPAGIVSLEDGEERFGQRFQSHASGVPIRAMRRGDLTRAQWSALTAGTERVRSLPVYLAYPLGGSLQEVVACVRRLREEHRCEVIYVDYLQAIGGRVSDKAMRHHIQETLEAMRRETAHGVTIVMGSQLKKPEREDDLYKRPHNGQLYEAAYIHQKADVIVLLWKDGRSIRRWALTKHKDVDDQLTGELRSRIGRSVEGAA